MLFSIAICAGLLLTPVVLAAPELARGHMLVRRSQQLPASNLAGVSISRVNRTFESVTGTVIVPALSGQKGGGVNIYTAIDSAECRSGAFVLGLKGSIGSNGTGYVAWYSDPSRFQYLSIVINAGDTVNLTLSANSSSGSSSATVFNTNTGMLRHIAFNSSQPTCGQSVAWALEADTYPNFPAFDLATFVNAEAMNSTGGIYTPSDPRANISQVVNMNGLVLTNTTTSGTTILIQYTGSN